MNGDEDDVSQPCVEPPLIRPWEPDMRFTVIEENPWDCGALTPRKKPEKLEDLS